MAASSGEYHEPYDLISEKTRDMHRALVSIQEELEAVDWYRQRADACGDDELREILLHNMREEIEHASMLIEWVRRREGSFDEQLRTYLFTETPITEVEEEAEKADVLGKEGSLPSDSGDGGTERSPRHEFSVGMMKGW